METLPIEIISQIMGFLPLDDRNSCSLVCKKWYSSLQDPAITSRLVCRLDLQNDAKEVTEVAHFARSRLISHLTICDSCPCAQSCKETMFWMDKDVKFDMITTLHLGESVDHERVNILMCLTTHFINVQVVQMYISFLLGALDDIANRDKVSYVIQKIPQINLVVGDHFYCKLPAVMKMKLNCCSLLFKNKVLEISANHRNKLITTCRSLTSGRIETLPLEDLMELCSQYQCALHIPSLKVSLPGNKLSEVVEILSCVPKLSVRAIDITHNLTSIMEEESSYLLQISNFGVNQLVLRSTSYVHNWLSKEFLSSAILGHESFTKTVCHGKVDKTTLEKIFSYCPFAECVEFTSLGPGKGTAISRFITVKYRTALNRHLKLLHLFSEYSNAGDPTYSDLLSVVPLHLREFSMMIPWENSHSNDLMKLNDRCPNIRKLNISFKPEGIHPNFLGKMSNLEELALGSYVKNVMENMSLPRLKKLTLWFESSTEIDTVFEIVRAFQGIKSLNLKYSINRCSENAQGYSNDGLKEGLSVLTELEELKLHLNGYVNGETFEALSSLAPPLTSLTLLRPRDDNDFEKRLRRFQNMHPNVKVIFITNVGNNKKLEYKT